MIVPTCRCAFFAAVMLLEVFMSDIAPAKKNTQYINCALYTYCIQLTHYWSIMIYIYCIMYINVQEYTWFKISARAHTHTPFAHRPNRLRKALKRQSLSSHITNLQESLMKWSNDMGLSHAVSILLIEETLNSFCKGRLRLPGNYQIHPNSQEEVS